VISKVFGSVEVMSAMILGFATLGAASLNVVQEARKAKRAEKENGPQRGRLRRPLIMLSLAFVLVAAGFVWATGSLQASADTFARRVVPTAKKQAATSRPAATAENRRLVVDDVRPAAPIAASMPEKSSGKLEDWLQAEGTKLYYRYTRYLPDACPGTPIAIGNWAEGEARPVTARCIDGGWIALDLGPLVQEGRIAPNMTYCLNFRAANGAWGIHAPEGAPGIDSIGVPAVRVPLGHAIGVRYLPGNPRERIVPTSETPRANC
jgi:hypothetical protein